MGLFDFILSNSPRTPEQRKRWTEKRLKKENIPINTNLPFVEGYKSVKLRDSREVVKRILILAALIDVAHKFENTSKSDGVSWLKKANLWDSVSPNEIEYLTSKTDDENLSTQISWRVEVMKVLFWSLGLIEKLDRPIELSKETNEAHEKSKKQFGTMANFINQAKLRETEEILDETDYIYRLHWAVRQAQLSKLPIPGRINPDIVYERHFALNWLTCYSDDWDDITCDT